MTMVMTMMTSMIMMMISSSAGATTATTGAPSPPFAGLHLRPGKGLVTGFGGVGL
jgi:hypothetical protein